MRRSLTAALVLLSATSLTGCYATYANHGVNQTNLQTVDFSQGLKQGEACATTLLGLFTSGSALIADAAKTAGIKKVEMVENKVSGNPFKAKTCVVVSGR